MNLRNFIRASFVDCVVTQWYERTCAAVDAVKDLLKLYTAAINSKSETSCAVDVAYLRWELASQALIPLLQEYLEKVASLSEEPTKDFASKRKAGALTNNDFILLANNAALTALFDEAYALYVQYLLSKRDFFSGIITANDQAKSARIERRFTVAISEQVLKDPLLHHMTLGEAVSYAHAYNENYGEKASVVNTLSAQYHS